MSRNKKEVRKAEEKGSEAITLGVLKSAMLVVVAGCFCVVVALVVTSVVMAA